MPYQDGIFPSGAPTLTINSVTYKCNAFSYTDGSTVVEVTDNNHAPSGALIWANALTGTAELQFAASSTPEPTSAASNATTGVFQTTLYNVSSNCAITSVTVNKPKDSPWTASITWRKNVN